MKFETDITLFLPSGEYEKHLDVQQIEEAEPNKIRFKDKLNRFIDTNLPYLIETREI